MSERKQVEQKLRNMLKMQKRSLKREIRTSTFDKENLSDKLLDTEEILAKEYFNVEEVFNILHPKYWNYVLNEYLTQQEVVEVLEEIKITERYKLMQELSCFNLYFVIINNKTLFDSLNVEEKEHVITNISNYSLEKFFRMFSGEEKRELLKNHQQLRNHMMEKEFEDLITFLSNVRGDKELAKCFDFTSIQRYAKENSFKLLENLDFIPLKTADSEDVECFYRNLPLEKRLYMVEILSTSDDKALVYDVLGRILTNLEEPCFVETLVKEILTIKEEEV